LLLFSPRLGVYNAMRFIPAHPKYPSSITSKIAHALASFFIDLNCQFPFSE
jgi:hypothetical protein